MNAHDDELDGFAARMQALGELIEELEGSREPKAVEPARALLRAVLAVHESGLRALLAGLHAAAGSEGAAWLRAACSEPSVSSLLLMHDLHPAPLAQRVQRALDQANATALGDASAELIAIDGQQVSVEVRTGRSDGASAGAGTRLRARIEALMVEHAPDATMTIYGGEAKRAEQLVPASRLIARIGGQPR
jgi:hypothetical protein